MRQEILERSGSYLSETLAILSDRGTPWTEVQWGHMHSLRKQVVRSLIGSLVLHPKFLDRPLA